MKSFKILLLLLLPVLLMSATWRTDFDVAKKEAADAHKLILVRFSGSDWCLPCIRMEREIFSKDAFTRYADSGLVLIKADFPRLKKNMPAKAVVKSNEALAARYNKEGHFPVTVLLDEKGNVLHRWDGYKGGQPEAFVAEIRAHRK